MAEIDFKNGRTIRLLVQGYEFPQASLDDFIYDRNWLMVQIEVQSGSESWRVKSPALLTWELEALIEAFRCSTTHSNRQKQKIIFLEPNLSFKLVPLKKGQILLRVCLDAEFKPASSKNHTRYCLEGLFSTNQISNLADQLQEQLGQFPGR